MVVWVLLASAAIANVFKFAAVMVSNPLYNILSLVVVFFAMAAIFAILTRLHKSGREDLDAGKKLRLYAGEDVEKVSQADVERIHKETPEEGLTGVSPRFVVNALSNAITRSAIESLTSMSSRADVSYGLSPRTPLRTLAPRILRIICRASSTLKR